MEWELSPLPIESSSADNEYEWVYEAHTALENGIEIYGRAYFYGDYMEDADFRHIEYEVDDLEEEEDDEF